MGQSCVVNSLETMGRLVSSGAGDQHESLADRLEALAIEIRSLSDAEMQMIPSEDTLVATARKVYAARRKVDNVFGMAGFAVTPAWDIMLDMYQAYAKGRDESVSSVCIGASCPSTTALRWLQQLEAMGLVERQGDPHDRRRMLVRLTDSAVVKIAKALEYHL